MYMPNTVRDNYKDKEILDELYAKMSETDKDADRKMHIFEDWLEGDSFSTLSKTYDRTVERMRQIVTHIRWKYDFIRRTVEADPLEIYKQNFNVRIVNSLMRAGLGSMNDLTEMTESSFRKIRNLGRSSQEIIINRMIELGLHFKPEEETSAKEEPTEEEPSKMEPTISPQDECKDDIKKSNIMNKEIRKRKTKNNEHKETVKNRNTTNKEIRKRKTKNNKNCLKRCPFCG